MKRAAFLGFMMLSGLGFSQVLHNPQNLYDSPGGLFDTDSLRSIHLNFYDGNYHAILVNGWYAQTGLRLPASLQMNGITLDSVGVRYKGNSTFVSANDNGLPKLPLNIDINYYTGGQKLVGYKKLKLANSLIDPTFCKEITAYNIYRRYLPSPEASFMKVYVQGDYLGLYVNTESVNKQFLEKHFGEKEGALFKCDPIQQFGQPGPTGDSNLEWHGTDSTDYFNHYELKSEHGWQDLIALIYAINHAPENLDSILNMDRVLWAFAANTVLANLDTYNGIFQHNYYLYQTGDGLFQMIPWDLTETFVGAILNFTPDNHDTMYYYDPFAGFSSWYTPLMLRLNNRPFHQKLYAAHIRTIIEESLDVTAIGNYVANLQSTALDAASTDPYSFFPISDYYYNVDNPLIIPGIFETAGITSTVALRRPYLLSHPEISKIPPDIDNVSLSEVSGQWLVTASLTNASLVEVMATVSAYNSKFRATEMFDDGTNGDAIGGDNIFTAVLPLQSTGMDVKFYIRAQNQDAIKLEPQRAEYEFFVLPQASGIAEFPSTAPDFKIYPNPFNDKATIAWGKNRVENTTVNLYNLAGEKVSAYQSYGPQLTIEKGHLPAGMYIVELERRNEVTRKKLIIQ